MITDILGDIITKVAHELGYKEKISVIKSNRPDLCDYQSDEVFRLTKIYHKNPIDIGEEIVKKINEIDNFNDYFSKVEFCKPGFINLTLSDKFINDLLKIMGNKEKFNLKMPSKIDTYVLDYEKSTKHGIKVISTISIGDMTYNTVKTKYNKFLIVFTP